MGNPFTKPTAIDEELLASVTKRCEAAGQSHILAHISDNAISQEDKLSFLKSVDEIPLEKLSDFLQGALEEEEKLKNFDRARMLNHDVLAVAEQKSRGAAFDSQDFSEKLN